MSSNKGRDWTIGAVFLAVVGVGLYNKHFNAQPSAPTPAETIPQQKVAETAVPAADERKAYYFAVAADLALVGIGQGESAGLAEQQALKICNDKREKRFANGAYVSKEGCQLRSPMASNYNGASCIAVLETNENYRVETPVLAGTKTDIETTVNGYLRQIGKTSRLFNVRLNPDNEIHLLCVDYYGKPNWERASYRLTFW